MDPSAIRSYRGAIDRAHREVERLAALSAQTDALNRGMKQEPKRHALAAGGGVFLPRITIGLVKCTPVSNDPIMPCPFRCASPIGGTARIPVFRAGGSAARITAYARKKMPAVIAQILIGGH